MVGESLRVSWPWLFAFASISVIEIPFVSRPQGMAVWTWAMSSFGVMSGPSLNIIARILGQRYRTAACLGALN